MQLTQSTITRLLNPKLAHVCGAHAWLLPFTAASALSSANHCISGFSAWAWYVKSLFSPWFLTVLRMLWPFFGFEYSSRVLNRSRTCAQKCLWLEVPRPRRSFCHLRWAWAALNWECKAGHLMRPFILQAVQQGIKITVWEQGETTQLVNSIRISPTNDASCVRLCLSFEARDGERLIFRSFPFTGGALCSSHVISHPIWELWSTNPCWNCAFLFCCCSLWQVSEVVGDRTSGVSSLFSISGAFRWWFCMDCIMPLGPNCLQFQPN